MYKWIDRLEIDQCDDSTFLTSAFVSLRNHDITKSFYKDDFKNFEKQL